MVGKAASRKFFPPMLTCSPAGQHILSTSVGLTGQTQPYCPPTHPLWSELQEWESHLWRYWGVVGKTGRHFQLNHTFQWFPPPVFFRCSHCKWGIFSKGEEKALNISTCGTSVTWLFPFQTLDLCLPATTQEEEGSGGERCGQSGNAEDGGGDYVKRRPLLNMSLLSIIHRHAQTSVEILSQPRSHSDEAWRELSVLALNICRCQKTLQKMYSTVKIWVKKIFFKDFHCKCYCLILNVLNVPDVGGKFCWFCQTSHVFGQTQASRATIQPGFLSYYAENGSHQGKWEPRWEGGLSGRTENLVVLWHLRKLVFRILTVKIVLSEYAKYICKLVQNKAFNVKSKSHIYQTGCLKILYLSTVLV